jgi:hypothetical protein
LRHVGTGEYATRQVKNEARAKKVERVAIEHFPAKRGRFASLAMFRNSDIAMRKSDKTKR